MEQFIAGGHSTSDTDSLSSSAISSTSVVFMLAVAAMALAAPAWWPRRCRRTYLWQLKRREHSGHLYLGAPPCRASRWHWSEWRLVKFKPHSLQTSSLSRRRYLSGRRCGCVEVRWLIRLSSRVNWRPQPSHVCWHLCSCNCRWWIRSVNALPSILPHWSQRCSTAPWWTVEMWSVSCASRANVREQYSQTNDFSAWT